jgi:hypothetical protein
VFHRADDEDTVFVVVGAGNVGDADDPAAAILEEFGRVAADVAEALNRDGRFIRAQTHLGHLVERADRYAAARRFDSPARTADLQRLAGYDAGHVLAHVHRVGIHEPRHDLRRGIDVGRRHVFVGADDLDELGRVTARDAFEFVLGERRRIAGDAAFTAAERKVDHRALPGHPKCEGGDLIQGYARMVADAALCRTAREIVLHSIAGIDFELAGVALEWN